MAGQMEVELQQSTSGSKAKSECAEDRKRDVRQRETWDELLGNIVHEFVYYWANPKRCTTDLQRLNDSKKQVQAQVAAVTEELEKVKQYQQQLPRLLQDYPAKCAALEHQLKQLEAEFEISDADYKREDKLYAELKDIIAQTEMGLFRKKLEFYSVDKVRYQILVDQGRNAQIPLELLEKIAATYESLEQIEAYVKNLTESAAQKHREFAQVDAKRQRLLREVNDCRGRLNQVSQEKRYLQEKLQRAPKVIQSLKEQLKAGIKSDCDLSKAILKVTFINSLIATEEKEKLMLKAVDLDVGLPKKFVL